ncbi:MAG: hypothetical protein R3C56_29935 [Pirellulaceae bacterium]
MFELKQDQWSARPLGVRSPADAATLEPPVAEEPVAAEPGLAIEPSVAKRAQYRTHVPVYDLIAAASGFGDDGAPEAIGWVRVADQAVSPGMFAGAGYRRVDATEDTEWSLVSIPTLSGGLECRIDWC